jgi:hypothetical protein
VLLFYSPGALPGAKLSAYDPASGKMTATRSFPAAAELPINGNYTGYLLRPHWNADFSAMIAQGPVASDGSAGAGITDPSGNYKPLTAGTSGGYGSPAVKVPLGFNPLTGRLWYVNGVDAAGNTPLGSVDPQVGPASDRRESTAKHSAGFYYAPSNGASNVGYFAPDGFGPADANVFGTTLFLPGGTELGYVAAGGELQVQVGKEGTLSDNGPYLPVTSNQPVGVPKLPVRKNSFVAFGDTVPTQLYLCTIGASQITASPLLPASTRVIQDVGVDPTGTKLAFVSTAGDVASLYTVSLAGSHQLNKLGDIALSSGDTVHVLAWN